MGNYMTISLRADERAAIKEKMEEYGMKQHEVVKLAIRQYLWPKQKTDIPLNGTSATIQDVERKVILKKESERNGKEISDLGRELRYQ